MDADGTKHVVPLEDLDHIPVGEEGVDLSASRQEAVKFRNDFMEYARNLGPEAAPISDHLKERLEKVMRDRDRDLARAQRRREKREGQK